MRNNSWILNKIGYEFGWEKKNKWSQWYKLVNTKKKMIKKNQTEKKILINKMGTEKNKEKLFLRSIKKEI